ncbi:hypothetical protein ASPBRDRAFT_37701 [Aspergillus brasiliensis CBS 101740]|uniref:Uncharacterized protein n=1 Tax=Aspergillus brasiliensis (strain CBS 101740 / IMI 381727 / IBT 21946) TaxID=767769 RepID=A0A1L9UUM7_ASPBC|nr:hypothetical protein ASPBRDRAFT_37701 [Aspergillus brasiliensis CBS 101740]
MTPAPVPKHLRQFFPILALCHQSRWFHAVFFTLASFALRWSTMPEEEAGTHSTWHRESSHPPWSRCTGGTVSMRASGKDKGKKRREHTYIMVRQGEN